MRKVRCFVLEHESRSDKDYLQTLVLWPKAEMLAEKGERKHFTNFALMFVQNWSLADGDRNSDNCPACPKFS